MSNGHYMLVCEETIRGTKPAVPIFVSLPVQGNLEPKFTPKDESKKEFRGNITALGNVSVIRRSSDWSHTVTMPLYPGPGLGLQLKHLLGKASTRILTDTTAYRGVSYPTDMPYGAGSSLENKAIRLFPHKETNGTTHMQDFGGGRIKSATFTFKPGGEDVMVTFEYTGAGDWVGTPDQVAISGQVMSTIAAYCGSDFQFFIGDGAVKTGVPPDYVDLSPGTMQQFIPIELTIKIENGLSDIAVCNQVKGASETTRSAQFKVTAEITVNYSDPTSGFSSRAEANALFTGPQIKKLMILGSHSLLAGELAEPYQIAFDLPSMLFSADGGEASSEGIQTTLKMKYDSMYSINDKYPIGILTVDQETVY